MIRAARAPGWLPAMEPGERLERSQRHSKCRVLPLDEPGMEVFAAPKRRSGQAMIARNWQRWLDSNQHHHRLGRDCPSDWATAASGVCDGI